jgi:hypothetical protein
MSSVTNKQNVIPPSSQADDQSHPAQMFHTTPKISTTCLPILKAPGPDSNFLNWRKVVQCVLKLAKVHHTLTSVDVKLCSPTWDEHNDLVCAVLVQIVEKGNLRYLTDKDDASKIWGDLTQAHQDLSTGGRVFWICKLVNAQMDGNDINSHIDSLAKSHKRLNSLVTPEDPFTPDDVHNAALLSSLQPDWIHCVSNLMNQEGVKTKTIVKSLRNEAIWQESKGGIISVSSAKPKQGKPNSPAQKPKTQDTEAPKKPCRCLLCNSDTHNLNLCNNTRNLIMEHKAAQKAFWEASQQQPQAFSSKPPARAGCTSAATLGNYAEIGGDHNNSDYSGSEVGVIAGNAIVSLSTPPFSAASGDSNLDSGCQPATMQRQA